MVDGPVSHSLIHQYDEAAAFTALPADDARTNASRASSPRHKPAALAATGDRLRKSAAILLCASLYFHSPSRSDRRPVPLPRQRELGVRVVAARPVSSRPAERLASLIANGLR